jgi:hypothetical protein
MPKLDEAPLAPAEQYHGYEVTPLLFVAVALLPAPLLASENRKPGPTAPRFEDYPVGEVWRGPNAPVSLPTRRERMFRTILAAAGKKPPNFAGHYRFETWGCGTECVAGALIDLQTGNVFRPPLAGEGRGWENWIISPSMWVGSGIDFRPDSSLMVVRCGGKFKQDQYIPEVHYFVWDGRRFSRTSPATGERSP